jgi:hypothetical protein
MILDVKRSYHESEPESFQQVTEGQNGRRIEQSVPWFSLLPIFGPSEHIFRRPTCSEENSVNDAAVILMQDYGLTCVEAGDLLNVTVC